jgi:hypothetical protein
LLRAHGAAQRWFCLALAATLIWRFWLAARLPITGDEAYFVFWGEVPDWGFYDHPPMVGWLLAALLKVSHATWWLRLPQIVLPGLVAIVMTRLLAPLGTTVAYAAATAYLLVPTQVLNVAITTDTPLLAFSFLSVAAFLTGLRRESRAWFALAGALLGLAFLSKYLAVLLGFAYLVFTLVSPRWRERWSALALVAVAASPFVMLNLWWNYEHCWANVLFNVYNRHGNAVWSVRTPLFFAALAIYATSPLLLWQLARAKLRDAWSRTPVRFLLLAAFVPLAVFAALSGIKSIGLHWLFSFVPALFLAAAHVLTPRQLYANVKFLACFSALHVVAVTAVLFAPVETFARLKAYDGIVMTFKSDELLAALKPYEGKYVFGSDGYSPAVTLGFNAERVGLSAALPGMGVPRNYFLVFGPASSHARHDDILTDIRKLDGSNILIVRKTAPAPAEYEPYFASIAYSRVDLHGATVHLVLGDGFRYAAYRDGVLAPARERYYRVPGYLPQGACWFCERYFAQTTCPVTN